MYQFHQPFFWTIWHLREGALFIGKGYDDNPPLMTNPVCLHHRYIYLGSEILLITWAPLWIGMNPWGSHEKQSWVTPCGMTQGRMTVNCGENVICGHSLILQSCSFTKVVVKGTSLRTVPKSVHRMQQIPSMERIKTAETQILWALPTSKVSLWKIRIFPSV